MLIVVVYYLQNILQGPAKNWENVLLSLGVAGGEPGSKVRRSHRSPRRTWPHHEGH
jgi:hypothetical protein